MKRGACLFLFLCHLAAGQTVVQKLFANVAAIGTASIQNTGQVGHQVYVLASNAPTKTCATPLIVGQLEFSFDSVAWTQFGSPVAIAAGPPASFATSKTYSYVGSGTFNYLRFNLTAFDTVNCLISAWYTGSAQPIYFSNQGPAPAGLGVGLRAAGGLLLGINPIVNGGLASGATAAPLVLCDITAQVTATAGTTALVVNNNGGTAAVNVCAVAVTMATTGTFQFVTGTGLLCAGAPTPITPVFSLNAGTPFTLGNGTGTVMSNIIGPLVSGGFAAGSANIGGNICVVAVGGNVSVMMTYALY
jgi:hypothetical protein